MLICELTGCSFFTEDDLIVCFPAATEIQLNIRIPWEVCILKEFTIYRSSNFFFFFSVAEYVKVL